MGFAESFFGVHLFQHLLDALEFVLGNQGLAKLLQVQGRMELRCNRTNLVARKNVI